MGTLKKSEKLVLITGGSRGIGKALVIHLASLGYRIAFTFNVDEESGKLVEKDLITLGGHVKAFQMSLEERISVSSTLKKVEKEFSKSVDVLINNAAIAQEKPFLDITDDDWSKMLSINLQGAFICIQETIPHMIENGWGRIINISSIGGQWGGLNQVHYAASKSALINLSRSLAKLYSSYGITSNSVAIGLAQTDMSSEELISPEGKEKVLNIPIGRIASLEEIAHTVEFLCTDKASYITGQTINLNGGMFFGAS